MKLFKILFIALLLSGCASKPSVTEPEADKITCNFPKRIGFVNDYCNFLTAEEIKILEKTASDFYAKTGTQIIIVVEDSKKSHSRKFHCPANIAYKWKLAPPDKFDDILVVISWKRTFIDLSYGWESANSKLSGADRTKAFKKMIPSFYKRKYYEGLKLGVEYIIEHRKTT